jgi:RHS repeat-associated protein
VASRVAISVCTKFSGASSGESDLPFGGIDAVAVDTGALAQTLRFPGQWFQAETGPGSGSGAGLHQNWHRDYDPTTGRYLQADPLGLVDGPSVYGYARQSPVRFTDPRGMELSDFEKPNCKTILVGRGSAKKRYMVVCFGQPRTTYCPSGDCGFRGAQENNTEYDQCVSNCNTLIKRTGRFVYCAALGTTTGAATGTGLVGDTVVSTVCEVLVFLKQCELPCFEMTCRGG